MCIVITVDSVVGDSAADYDCLYAMGVTHIAIAVAGHVLHEVLDTTIDGSFVEYRHVSDETLAQHAPIAQSPQGRQV